MTSFFERIDPTKPFLFLGEADHYNGVRSHVFSSTFLKEAAGYDYDKILIEGHTTEMDDTLSCARRARNFCDAMPLEYFDELIRGSGDGGAIRWGAITAGRLGIDLIFGDPRSKEEKKALIEWEENARLTMPEDTLEQEISRRGCAKDDELVQNIRAAKTSGKLIVFFGSGHFELGLPVEREISEAERTIVNLYANEKAMRNESGVLAPDTACFIIETGELIPAARNITPVPALQPLAKTL